MSHLIDHINDQSDKNKYTILFCHFFPSAVNVYWKMYCNNPQVLCKMDFKKMT